MCLEPSSKVKPTLLDSGHLPVENLARLALREARRPRPIYHSHKWFARRFGSAFRAILTAACLPEGSDFWRAYYEGVDYREKTVLDPFVGGGTSLIEAKRLGANVIGIDIDPVACAITDFETHMFRIPDLTPTLNKLEEDVGEYLAPYYKTKTDDNETRIVLHYFWVQVVECYNCGQLVEAHPHYLLAYEAKGTYQWVFCPYCHNIKIINKNISSYDCNACGANIKIHQGSVNYGKMTCPNCNYKERLIDIGKRSGSTPRWRLFALETLEPPYDKKVTPMSQRFFRSATDYDKQVLDSVERALRGRTDKDGSILWIPAKEIPADGRSDDRLLKYGYKSYKELFNSRQLLHLSYLAEAVSQLESPIKDAFAIAFSDHLTTNCMMASYAFGWRRLVPLFSVRAYRHITRPVEINPWLDGSGRGTFPNNIRQVQRAIDWTRSPKEPLIQGGFCAVNDRILEPALANIFRGNSQNLSFINKDTIDLVLTDPPYFDNISYSELSDFFLPWLVQFNLITGYDMSKCALNENLAANDRTDVSIDKFEKSLSNCFSEIARVLKPDGRLVFTYQHQTSKAWHALSMALLRSGFRAVQLFPLLGDSHIGLHKYKGSIKWDAVFVMVKGSFKDNSELKISEETARAAKDHYQVWTSRLENDLGEFFAHPDKINLYRACLAAGSLGMFQCSKDDGSPKPLSGLLDDATRLVK